MLSPQEFLDDDQVPLHKVDQVEDISQLFLLILVPIIINII